MMISRIDHKRWVGKEPTYKKATPAPSRVREQVERMSISKLAVAVAVAIHHG